MNLLKTSLLSLISTAVKLVSGIVINKAVSVFIGPAGLALIGQFQNAAELMMTLAQGGINSGVTKYTAQYGQENGDLPKLWSTAARIVLLCSFAVGFILIFCSTYISDYVLNSREYSYVFIVFGFTLVFFTLNQLLLSVINGLKEIRLFIIINITQSVYSLIFTTLLVIAFGLHGALVALVTNQSVIFVTLLWRLRNHKAIILNRFKCRFDSEQGKKLAQYSLMAVTSACVVPISHLYIRNYIGESLSWEEAGYWQAIWYISSTYLLVITTALSTYYLPRLSEISSKSVLRAELIQGCIIIMPIVIMMSLSIYLLRDFILWLLFTDDFIPMLELFKWQLIGDVIKIAAWLFSFLMVAKSMTKAFIISEVIFSISFVLISIYTIDAYGLIGITYSYVINYSLYLVAMILVTSRVIV